MPSVACLGRSHPVEADDLTFDQFFLLVVANVVQKVVGLKANGQARRREPVSGRLEIIRVDRQRMLLEKFVEVQLVVQHTAPRLTYKLAGRERPAHAEYTGLFEDFSRDRLDGPGVVGVGSMRPRRWRFRRRRIARPERHDARP